MSSARKTIFSDEFKGLSFVFTGTLERLTRKKASQEVLNRGGKVTSSVSKTTDYVVAGRDPGSKFDKAKGLDVKILTEEDFLHLLEER